jgi:hypothetical protein
VSKPILCIDFDGVIHSYERGWQDGGIYGTATEGFFAWAIEAVKLFKLVVYSSRSKEPDGARLMSEAIGKWSIDAIDAGEVPRDYDWSELFGDLTFANEKPPAFLTIDDRAVQFTGDWSILDPVLLRSFKPWNAGGSEKV